MSFDLTWAHGNHASRTPRMVSRGSSSSSCEKSSVLGFLTFCTT